jgi:hypothetical protein
MDSTHTMSGAGRQILLGVVSGLNVLIAGSSTGDRHQRARLAQILDLLGEDTWRRVYAGEREVRPPAAPTTGSAAAPRELLPQRLRGPGEDVIGVKRTAKSRVQPPSTAAIAPLM